MGMHNKATHSLAWAYSHSYSEALVVDPLPPFALVSLGGVSEPVVLLSCVFFVALVVYHHSAVHVVFCVFWIQ